jgi:radical SAM superfamily enzyme YgiQ (UPF0313 family)
LIEKFPDREMEFVAMNGISYLSLDDELLELMHRAGFSQLNLALVSSDKTVRETTKRPHTLAAYLKVVRKAHELGFRIVSYQILGLPDETLDSMIQTLAFNARLPVLLGASPFYRTPSAPIARGLELTETDYVRARLTALAIETENFTRDDIYTLFVSTRILNFLKGLRLSESADLLELTSHRWPDIRTRIGFAILEDFRTSGRMHFWTNTGLVENTRFKSELLIDIMSETKEVMCQSGARIDVRKFVESIGKRKPKDAALKDSNAAIANL